jgi:hypothetical protein
MLPRENQLDILIVKAPSSRPVAMPMALDIDHTKYQAKKLSYIN